MWSLTFFVSQTKMVSIIRFILYMFLRILKRLFYRTVHKISPCGFAQRQHIISLLGADKYHSAGYYGQNIFIDVLDTCIVKHKDVSEEGRVLIGFTDKQDAEYAHGTHVFGIIDNLAPKANVRSIPMFPDFDSKFTTYMSSGFGLDAPDIINISAADNEKYGAEDSHIEYQRIYKRCEDEGILVVISSGNYNSIGDDYMEQRVNTLTQSSLAPKWGTDHSRSSWPIVVSSCKIGNNKLCKFNTINKSITCASYGNEIISYGVKNNYVRTSGTSMAAPQVTGCLALILSYIKDKYPELTKYERAQLARTWLVHQCTYIDEVMDDKTMPQSYHNLVTKCRELSVLTEKDKYNIKRLLTTHSHIDSKGTCDVERFVSLYVNLKIRFAQLGVGYGIVEMKDFPPRQIKDIMLKEKWMASS